MSRATRFSPHVTSWYVINYLNSRDSVSGEGEEQAWSVLASAASTSESPTAFTKFYVVDSFADMTFGYGSDGSATTSFGLSRDVNQPSGITSNKVGDTLWVIDQRTHQVTVQASNAKLVGSWTAEGLVDPQGITTDGTDIWIVDAAQDRVVRYARAAVLTLGTADASDTFALDVENSSPSDITTDGSTVWVTDDQTDEVFVYDVAGALLGHWRLDPANADPSGITLDPSGGNDLWVVDRNDSEVYHYANSISLRDGSRVASDAFPLSGGNQHPEGIADPPIVTVSDPIGETALPAGQTLVLTGQTLDTNGPAAVVRIDGQAADAVDAAGNFFHQVQVAPGTNTYAIEASDTAGDTTTSTVTVRGTQLPAGAIDFAQLSVVSGSTFGLYGRTSWQDADSALYADFSIQNIGQYTVDGPVLVGVTNISDPTVRLRGPTGTTPDGIPYFDMSSLLNGDSLPPGDSSGLQTVSFFVPGRVHFTYDLVFFAAVNQPPRITTVPDVEAVAGREYVYDVAATDPNGDALTFALLSSPDGMQIAAETGEITWSPGAADVGTHDVIVQVNDGRGGSSEQRFVLSAIEPPPNRPPLFTSNPAVDASVNVTYSYQSRAADPDDDTLSFSIISGPTGLSISTAGLVTWTPDGTQIGTHDVVLQADDGSGGQTTQAYVIAVGQEPGNHAPLIVSDPVTQFNIIGPSNPATGDVNPNLLSLDLGLGDSATRTVSLTLPGSPPVIPPPSQTFPLTLGSTVSGTITVPFAEDNYTFTLTGPSLLYFDSLTNNSGLAWTLVGPAGTAVSNRSFTNSENSNPILNLVAGDYTLTVIGDGRGHGDLSVPALGLGPSQPIDPRHAS